MRVMTHTFHLMMLGLLLLVGCNAQNKEQGDMAILSISPDNGPRAGGIQITLTGTDLEFTNQVTIGGEVCTSLVVVSPTTLTCILPANPAGEAEVVVRNIANNFKTASVTFTYNEGATILSVSPTFGPTTGGTSVTVTGTRLSAGSVVRIGGALCSSPIYDPSETSITCTTSPRVEGLDLSATVLDLEGDSATLTNAFNYVAGPVISTVTPNSGRTEGFPTSPTITINGFAFDSGATVTIDGAACPTTSVTTTSIVCQPPAGTSGGKEVRVTNPDGLFGQRFNGYTYVEAPTVTAVSPFNGPTAGGQLVTITGTNFFSGMTVNLGGSACNSVSVTNSTSLTCVTTSRVSQGLVIATVTNSFGQSGVLADAYNYRSPPSFTSVTPTQIGVAGGAITITAADIFETTAGSLRVVVNGQSCTSVSFDDVDEITCTAPIISPPPTTPQAVNIQIINPDNQTDIETAALTYIPAPTVTSVTPNSGPLAADKVVVVNGFGFTATTTIDFLLPAVVACSAYDYSAIPAAITCTIPNQGLGPLTVANVRATNPTPSQTTTLTSGYTFRPAPTLTSTLPVSGSEAGGYNIIIEGTGFIPGALLNVTIGGVNCTSTEYISDTELRCVEVPEFLGGLPGTEPVVVTNGDGQVSTELVDFTYRLRPTITSVTANQGPAYQDLMAAPPITRQTLIINGSEFDTGASVTINGQACTIDSVNATEIQCTVPDAPVMVALPFDASIVVINTDGQVNADAFTYRYVASPIISSITPSNVSASAATAVTITGSNFSALVDDLTVAGLTCTGITVVSATEITCTVPDNGGISITGDVVFSQTDGLSSTLANGISLRNAPVLDPVSYTVSATTQAPLTIEGSEFYENSVVTFEAGATILPCPVTSVTAASITCTKPAFAAGGVFDIRVVNLTSPLLEYTLVGSVTFIQDPTITDVLPFNRGRAGDNITLVGTSFNGGTLQILGVDACEPATFVVVDANTITCTLAASADGLKDLTYTNSAGRSVTVPYTYLPLPTVSSITPVIGSASGGTAVTITGTGFIGTGWSVTIGSACNSVVVVSPTEIRCTTTASAAALTDVTVSLPSTSVLSTGGDDLFRYLAPPTPNVVTPNTLLQTTAPTLVSITTANRFEAPVSVLLGGQACTAPAVITPTEIQCTAQPHPTGGPVSVSVTNGDGQTASVDGLFTYTRAPTISGVTPAAGSITGGTVMTISGADFDPGSQVYLESVAVAHECTVISAVADEITCTTPNFSDDPTLRVPRDVIVVNPDTQNATRTNAFTYQSAPLITSISPALFGPIAGLNTITVNGDYFFVGVQVTIDGVTCGIQTRTNTQITCQVPPAPGGVVGGPYVLRVFNNDNQEATTDYSYVAAPTVLSFNSTLFKTGGLETLVITGTGFRTGATVTVGGLACSSLSVDSDTQITCTNPNVITAGQKSVVLTNLDGQSVTLANALLFLAPPNLAVVSPNSGTTSGGQTITLGGSGFYPGMTVTIGGVACGSVNVANTSTATCVTGASAAGPQNVQISVLGDTSTLNNAYTYRARPTISSVTPDNGSTAGGTDVVITGTNFYTGTVARFGGVNCTTTVLPACTVNCVTLECKAPARTAGVVNIVINNPDGQISTETVQYTYNSPPTITNVTPTSGPVAGGTVVTITGTQFVSGATVTIGGVACATTTFVSATSIQCTTPNMTSAGLKSIVITNPDTQSVTSTNSFQALAAPTLASVTPNSDLITGGKTVVFTGTNFVSGVVARINGVNCSSTVYLSNTSLQCVVPSAAAATNLTISVVNPDTQSANLANAFSYLDEAVLEWQVGAASPNPPNPDSFGSTVTNVSHTYTLRNVGTTVSGTIVTSIEGAQASSFTRFPADNCNGITLAAGASCTMDVTFLGGFVSSGSYTATLRATATASGTTDNVIQGTRP